MAVAKKLDGSETGFVKALSVLNEAGGDIAEEKFEQVFAGLDLSHLLQKNGVAGTAARIINAVHPDARLVALSTLAAYIDHRRDINPALKFVLVAALRAAPQSITAMLAHKGPLDEKALAAAMEVEVKVVAGRELYVGSKRTDLIHDSFIHPSSKDDVVNRGSLSDILSRFDRNLLCPDCFHKELNQGRVTIVTAAEPHKAGRAFRALAGFRDASKRRFFDAIEILATLEVDNDHGLGFEGKASHILAAHTLGLGNDPIGLEDIIPDDVAAADRMIELSELSAEEVEQERRVTGRVLLPLSARRYIHALLAAYRVDHPASNVEVRAKDWGDRLLSWVPSGLKTKKKGWAGVQEVATSPLGAIFLLLLGIFALLVIIPVACIALILVVVALIFLINIALSLSSIFQLFQPYLTPMLMGLERSAATVWITTVLLGILTWFDLRGAYRGVRSIFGGEVVSAIPVEFIRPKLLTIRVAAAAAGLISTIAGWGLGHISNFGVAGLITAIWFVILSVEATLKWDHRLPEDFKQKGLIYAVKSFGWGIVVCAAAAVFFFAAFRPEDADRAAALSTGVVNHGADVVAKAAAVNLPPSAEQCRKGLVELERQAAQANMKVARICELTNNEFPCDCR